jgi:cytidyltransferase-like protein
MDLLLKAATVPQRLGILPGSFHPITIAHVALAEAALAHVEEVLFVMPREFPHKSYEGMPLERRLELVRLSIESNPQFSLAITEGGLFIDIAREIREIYPSAELWFLCGKDAAERIVAWPYTGTTIEDQLGEYGLLVADRQGHYEPPPHLAARIRPLQLAGDYNEVSSTRIRDGDGAPLSKSGE